MHAVLPAVFAPDNRFKEVPLDEGTRASVQAYFQKIYDRIRIEEDPEKMPEIVLVQESGVAAFVRGGEQKIYIDVDFLGAVKTEDWLAEVFAHELTHLERHQEEREGKLGRDARILNELEAQTKGVLKRLCRMGLVDPVTGQPQAAVYSLEEVIRRYEADPTFRNEYGNFRNIAAAFKVYYAQDRYLRKYPKPTPIGKFVPSLKQYKVGNKIVREKVNPPSKPRKEVAKLAKLFGKSFKQKFEILLKSAANVNLPIEERQGALRQLATLFGKDIYEERSVSMQRFMTNLPSGTFRKIRNLEVELNERPFHSTYGLLEQGNLIDFTFDVLKSRSVPPNFDHDSLAQMFSYKSRKQNQDFSRLYFLSQIKKHRALLMKMGKEHGTEQVLWPIFASVIEHEGSVFDRKFVAKAREVLSGIGTDQWSIFLRQRYAQASMFESLLPDMTAEKVMGLEEKMNSRLRNIVFKVRPELTKAMLDRAAERGAIESLVDAFENNLGVSHAEKDAYFAQALQKNIKDAQQIRKLIPPKYILTLVTGKYPPSDPDEEWRKVLAQLSMKSPRAAARYAAYVDYLRKKEAGSNLLAGVAVAISGFQWDGDGGSGDYWRVGGNVKEFAENFLQGNGEKDWKAFETKYPESARKFIDLVVEAPLIALEKIRAERKESNNKAGHFLRLPMDKILPRLDTESFLSVLAMGREMSVKDENAEPLKDVSSEKKAYYIGAIAAEFLKRSDAKQLDARQTMLGLRLFLHMPGLSATKDVQSIVEQVHQRVLRQQDWGITREYLSILSPTLFSTTEEYRRQVRDLLSSKVKDIQNLGARSPLRPDRLKGLVDELLQSTVHLDPVLKQTVLNDLAVDVAAVPKERELLTAGIENLEGRFITGAEYTNALLEAYGKLSARKRWDFLQWVRGKNPDLQQEVTSLVRLALANHGIFIEFDDIEDYLRRRFDAMGPLAKAAFFQVALDGGNGLLRSWGYKNAIKREILANLSPTERKNVLDLFDAATKALPPVYESVILSTAFAESGKAASPEEALRRVIQRMGALVQKFGQNLAFDSHLPESYRQELQKLWDEGERPDWWKVQDLIKYQWGDIDAAGFRLVKIRNAGSTEVTVELEDADGKRHITSVQKEAVAHGAEVDAGDLKEFARILTNKWWGGRKKYGFMSILVEDSNRTLETELDPTHKMKMTPKMRENYIQSAKKLGGTYQNGVLHYKGWNIESPKFKTHALADGKTLITQEIAAGVPLKSIQHSHPQLYKQVSDLLIQIENEAQSNPNFPVDKDRMPGQVFVDIATGTITLLDHGQARMILPEVFQARSPFIGSALTGNTDRITEVLRGLGIELTPSEQSKMAADLSGVDAPFRPLHVLSWIFQTKKFPDKVTEDRFWDLVHVVRANARLAYWGESIGMKQVSEEWREAASKELTATQTRALNLLSACHRWSKALLDLFRR